MRVVLDTNVLISAFVFRRSCADLFERCLARHQLVASSHILREFRETLTAKFGFRHHEVEQRSRLLADCCHVVVPAHVPRDACRDPDDLPVLGTALAVECDCLVTGDNDLLALKSYKNISILSPTEFWRFEDKAGGR